MMMKQKRSCQAPRPKYIRLDFDLKVAVKEEAWLNLGKVFARIPKVPLMFCWIQKRWHGRWPFGGFPKPGMLAARLLRLPGVLFL
jgi:hypothetical protein